MHTPLCTQLLNRYNACMKKCASISIIGRPSAGKSTLLNAICGYKVSITAPSPQTTRNSIRGIYTAEKGQLIFIDTPGYHISDKSFNMRLKDITVSTLGDADILLYVVDTLRKPGEEEREIAELAASGNQSVVVALNKIDQKRAHPGLMQLSLEKLIPQAKFVEISAMQEKGIDTLKSTLFDLAPEGEQLYPEDFYTDQPPEFRIAEIIREKAVNRAKDELPHAIYVEIVDLEIDKEKNMLWIRAFINVERESQKGLVVGKAGSGIAAIRKEAQKEIARLFPYKIHLDIRVKAQGKWRKKDHVLKKLLY